MNGASGSSSCSSWPAASSMQQEIRSETKSNGASYDDYPGTTTRTLIMRRRSRRGGGQHSKNKHTSSVFLDAASAVSCAADFTWSPAFDRLSCATEAHMSAEDRAALHKAYERSDYDTSRQAHNVQKLLYKSQRGIRHVLPHLCGVSSLGGALLHVVGRLAGLMARILQDSISS